MSKINFTLEDAKTIAALAHRTHPPGPWVGREYDLLHILNIAKQVHDHAIDAFPKDSELLPTPKADRTDRDKCKQFADALLDIAQRWQGLPPTAKYWIAELFRDRKAETDKIGKLIRAPFAPDLNFLQCLEQANNLPVIFDGEAAAAAKQHFANLKHIAEHLKSKPPRKSGVQSDLRALKLFIWSLGEDWDASLLGASFAPEFDRDTGLPESAAAKLVCAAAALLGRGYTQKNCQNVWRPRRSKRPRTKGAQLKHKFPPQSRGL